MTIKVLTLNLRHNADRWPERLPLVVDTLLAESADVIGLQEVHLPIQQAELITNLLNDRVERPYSVFTGQKWGEHPEEGIAILSRLPVRAYEHTNLPETSRLAQRVRVEVNGRAVDVVNTHLHHEPFFDEVIRLPQMRHILDWMFARDGDHRWVLLGDLNALPASATIQAARQHLASALPADAATFPAPLCAAEYPPDRADQIDYILYDASQLRLLGAEVIARQTHPQDATLSPSDHYGVAAEFALEG
jgi:endonuclease/exonuclease/phosphatase family metal-dependent hydrolase